MMQKQKLHNGEQHNRKPDLPISKFRNPERPRAAEALAEVQAREQNLKIKNTPFVVLFAAYHSTTFGEAFRPRYNLIQFPS